MFWRFRLYGFLKNLRFFDPFLILFFREMGFPFLEIGILYSIREVATNILEIPTGILADAFGRRKAMLASFTAYIFSFALFYALPQFWFYALAMVVFAVGETFRSGTHKAMILEHLRLKGLLEHKVAYYGLTRAASQFGSAIAALIAGGLVLYAGSYRVVFLASVVPYILGLFLFLTYPRELDGERAPSFKECRIEAVCRMKETVVDFLSMLRRLSLVRGLLSSAGFDALFKSTKDYLQPVLQAQALALPIFLTLSGEQRVAILVGLLYFVIYLVTSFASAQAGTVQKKLSSGRLAINGSYLLGLILLVCAGASQWLGVPGIAVGAFLALYALQNIRRPILVGYLADLLAQRTMATGLSVESQLRTLVMAAIAPLLGFLADRWGVGPALLCVAGCGAVLFLLGRIRGSQSGE